MGNSTDKSQRFQNGTRAPALTRCSLVPLTFQQELALNNGMHEGLAYVNFCFAALLRGSLDIDVLGRSISAVVQRHESLRTRIVVVDEDLRQAIDEPSEFRLGVVECSSGSDAQRLLQVFFSEQVDLAIGPLFNVRLLKLSEKEHVLTISLNQLITDAVSQMLLFRELWSLYGDFIFKRPSSLPDVSLQYPRYARWQRKEHPRWLQEHEGYWKSKLAQATCIKLPIDSCLENVKQFSPGFIEISFDQALSTDLHDLARREGATPAMIMLSLYAVVLGVWSERVDLVIPFAVSGRPYSRHAGLIGFLSQYLALGIDLTHNEVFGDLVSRVSQEFTTSHDHLDFGIVIGNLPKLFKGAVMNWLPAGPVLATPSEWVGRDDFPTVEPFPFVGAFNDRFRLACDVECIFRATTRSISVSLLYRADLFRRETMARFCGDLRLVSEQVVSDRSIRVSSLQSLILDMRKAGN